MQPSPSELASLNSFSAEWSRSSKDADLQRWTAFLTQHGVVWSPEAKDREFIDQLVASSPARAGEFVELRLSVLGNAVLAKTGDARRLCKLVGATPPRAWYVLSPEQRTAFETAGHRFDSGMEHPLRQLATIPITVGAYLVAQHACRVAGLDPNVAWALALLAYVLTVRFVRGRWPLQR